MHGMSRWYLQHLSVIVMFKQLLLGILPDHWQQSMPRMRYWELLGFLGLHDLCLLSRGELLRDHGYCRADSMLCGHVLVGIVLVVLELCGGQLLRCGSGSMPNLCLGLLFDDGCVELRGDTT